VELGVRDMLDVGLDIVTDGGQYYENETGYEYAELFHVMAHRLEGYAPYGDRIQVGAFDLPSISPRCSRTSPGAARYSSRSLRPSGK
jgi:5-methyltetrahydropteroyltriglutamate--homocysteine methyltransferase